MYRSASWNRFSDEYYSHSSPAPSSKAGQALRLSSLDGNELPTNDPVVEMVKREKARVKFAESAVHVIPIVLILCAIVLWFFSNPGIDLSMRGETMTGTTERLTIDGEIENEFDGTLKGTIPIFDTTSSNSITKKITMPRR